MASIPEITKSLEPESPLRESHKTLLKRLNPFGEENSRKNTAVASLSISLSLLLSLKMS